MSGGLFLVWHDGAAEVELGEPMQALAPGFFMVRSERSLSKLYHAVKWQLADEAALCVAPLADAPKFKHMAPGALKWLRAGA